jgi:sialic acid synthase SpsE
MSSGMASMVEVAQAIDVIAAHGGPPLAVFHCVTSYPATAADTNLRAIDTMRAAFGVPAGLSDHTQGIAITLAAVARGAQLIEKHFTLDRAMEGPDHKASLEPHELKELMRALRDVEAALGDGVKAPRPAEVPLMAVARRSLHAARSLAAGHRLQAGDVVALRPGSGVSPARLPDLIGLALSRPLAAGELLTLEHVDGAS